MDYKQRIALVETRTQSNETGVPAPLIRYQFANHLGSASLELDDQAQIISYEEYTPYGGTSYQAARSQAETPKRYRFTGKERDEDNGFYYYGARYYAPWIGRWISCDPLPNDAVNWYECVRGNPTSRTDPDGREDIPVTDPVFSRVVTAPMLFKNLPAEFRLPEKLEQITERMFSTSFRDVNKTIVPQERPGI